MASDFNSCGFGAISPEMLVKSLLSGIQAFSACGIRTVAVDVSGKTLSSPHACSTAEDFWNLFLRSLVMADDDKVAIRTTYTASANGAGLDKSSYINWYRNFCMGVRLQWMFWCWIE
jgi:hypothetical protein